MKNATSKGGLTNILSEIITDEENNVYFTHKISPLRKNFCL